MRPKVRFGYDVQLNNGIPSIPVARQNHLNGSHGTVTRRDMMAGLSLLKEG